MAYNDAINRHVINRHTARVQRIIGGYHWQTIGKARFRMRGHQMQLAIPLRLMGISNAMPADFNFEWADRITKSGRWMDFHRNGDYVAPFRFYYRAGISR